MAQGLCTLDWYGGGGGARRNKYKFSLRCLSSPRYVRPYGVGGGGGASGRLVEGDGTRDAGMDICMIPRPQSFGCARECGRTRLGGLNLGHTY